MLDILRDASSSVLHDPNISKSLIANVSGEDPRVCVSGGGGVLRKFGNVLLGPFDLNEDLN